MKENNTKEDKYTPNSAMPTVSQTAQVTSYGTAIESRRNKRVRVKEGDPLNNQQAPKRKKTGQDILKTSTNNA